MELFIGNEIVTIEQKNKLADIKILLENDAHLLIKYVSGAHDDEPIENIIHALRVGMDHFGSLSINMKIHSRLEKYVARSYISTYTWTELTDKPNYGLEIFKNRFWPYFNVECKEWTAAAVAARSADYPPGQNSPNQSKDYELEVEASQKYNNFLGHTVGDPNKYIDVEPILKNIEMMSKIGAKKIACEMLVKMMIHPDTCVIKSAKFWELASIMPTNIVMYFMYYSMFILNHEYTAMFSRIKQTYRVIFTHKEALQMPLTFAMHPTVDPYIQQLTVDSLVTSVPFYLRCKRHIFAPDVFERRLFLASGGALTNINLKKYNAAISGSILIPCATYVSLEDDFKNVRFNTSRDIDCDIAPLYGDVETENDFMSYLEYYYPSYYSLTDRDFTSKVLTEIKPKKITMKEKIEEKNAELEKKDAKEKELPKTIEKYNLLSDIDISITTDNYAEFERIALIIIERIKANCSHRGLVYGTKIYTKSSFKYKVYGPGLIRPIDLFRVSYGPDKMVKKFHCPIVRSWYDGSNTTDSVPIVAPPTKPNIDIGYESDDVHDVVIDIDVATGDLNILVSCLSTMLSGVNNNYKWFFNSKPCTEVILKYMQRGFTTILTRKEIDALKKYMSTSVRWSSYISENIDVDGIMSANHVFFAPCMYNSGIRHGLREFKKPFFNIFSKRTYVGEYTGEFAVKTNDKVLMPDLKKLML